MVIPSVLLVVHVRFWREGKGNKGLDEGDRVGWSGVGLTTGVLSLFDPYYANACAGRMQVAIPRSCGLNSALQQYMYFAYANWRKAIMILVPFYRKVKSEEEYRAGADIPWRSGREVSWVACCCDIEERALRRTKHARSQGCLWSQYTLDAPQEAGLC